MHGAATASERFVEPPPQCHGAKERTHRAGMLTSSTIETARKLHPSWRFLIVFGLLDTRSTARAAAPLGSEFQVNTYTTYQQIEPSVSASINDEFLVVWASTGSGGSPGPAFRIRWQRTGRAVSSQHLYIGAPN